MNKIIIGAALLLVANLAYGQSDVRRTAADFEKLNWLEGTWMRTNSKAGHSGWERWEKISGTEWKGKAITLRGTDTTVVERLTIILVDGALYYEADVTENPAPIRFKFTEISTSHFVCENPTHDFPKKIAYRKEKAVLKATISGNGKFIDYLFEKK